MNDNIDNPPPKPSTPLNACHRCKIRQERWSYETDKDIIVSPTGKRLEIFAHDSAYNNHPLQPVVQATIQRSWSELCPKEADGPNRHFSVVYLTSAEMEAWQACYRAAEAHCREIRENLVHSLHPPRLDTRFKFRPGGPRRRRGH